MFNKKMFRPSLRTNASLIFLALVAIIVYIFVGLSHGPNYENQKSAAERMNLAINQCSQSYKELLSKNLVTWNKNLDPDKLGLIGPEASPIVTSRSNLEQKLRTINPNLAAVFTKWLIDAKLQKGDYVAVGVTGANPAVNIALYCAMKELELKPVIITALSSSRYGASDANFTWLDIEKAIYKTTGFKSMFASRGGNRDVAAGLSREGKGVLSDKIAEFNLQLLEGTNTRIKMYKKALPKGKKYKAFINIGAGVANVGSVVTAALIKEGVNTKIPEVEAKGIFNFFTDKKIPVIHYFNGNDTFQNYYLGKTKDTQKPIGSGIIYGYNYLVAVIGLIVLIIAITLVVIFDRKERHFLANIIKRED